MSCRNNIVDSEYIKLVGSDTSIKVVADVKRQRQCGGGHDWLWIQDSEGLAG